MTFTVVLHHTDARKGIRVIKDVVWYEVIGLSPVGHNWTRGLLVLKLSKGGHYSFPVGYQPYVLYHRLEVFNESGNCVGIHGGLGLSAVRRRFHPNHFH
jgi:hypothetical protein